MRSGWWDAVRNWLATPGEPVGHPSRDSARFDLGVCPGCKCVRAVTSLRCTHCGDARRVTADA